MGHPALTQPRLNPPEQRDAGASADVPALPPTTKEIAMVGKRVLFQFVLAALTGTPAFALSSTSARSG